MIAATVDVELLPAGEGGLSNPQASPTPSLVFRRLTRDGVGDGLVVLLAVDEPTVRPGMKGQARATFTGVDRDDVRPGERFALWHGARVVGEAVVRAFD